MVSLDEVEKVSENARISISEEEAKEFADDLTEVLEMFEKLEEVDTEGVDPAFHPVDVDPEKREDSKEETISRDEVFANTENEEDGYFKGPSA